MALPLKKKKCCVPGCSDLISSQHRFPNPKNELDMFHKWLQVIKNGKCMSISPETVYNNFRVCARHFKQDDIVKVGRRGIKRRAIPALFLEDINHPSTSNSCSFLELDLDDTEKVQDSSIIMEVQRDEENEPDTIGTIHSSPKRTPIRASSGSSLRRRNILSMVEVTRQNALTPKAKKLYRKVIDSCNKVSKLTKKVADYRRRLSFASTLSETEQFKNLATRVNSATYPFIISQIRLQAKHPKGRRFTEEEKILALTLFKSSGKGYRMLSKIFSLPSKRTLTALLNKIPISPGINKVMFESIKQGIEKMTVKDRNCILIFDEMYLATNLQYNQKSDIIEGIEDYGTDRFPNLADHINVFMIKGVYRQWKQPICYTFSNGATTSMKLKNFIKRITIELQAIGLNVVATVCDQGGPNAAAIRSLIKESKEVFLREGTEYKYFGFFIGSKEIVPLFDVPHIFKGIRNNLLNKDLHFQMPYRNKQEKGIAKWEHIEQFYNIDSSEPIRICPKLTDEHVVRNKIKKMKVKNCTQVFSHQVGSLMLKIVEWKAEVNLVPEAVDTGRLILFLDQLFDSLNSGQKTAPSSKPLKGGLTLTSPHEQFWRDAINHLNTMKFCDKKTNQFKSVPSLSNLIWTIRGFLYLKNKLLKNSNNFLLLRVFQQDALENFFGIIRSYNARNTSPNVSNVISTFKALLINNFMSSHSPGANCEKDFSEGALNNVKLFLTSEMLPGCQLLTPKIEINIPSALTNYKRTRIGSCTVTYVAGYVAKKLLNKVTCTWCRTNILFRDSSRDLDFIEARTYTASCLTKPGTFFNYLVSECLSRLFYLIPRICHLHSVLLILVEELMKNINFNPINCSQHTNLGLHMCQLIVRVSLYFWCKRVNLIARGKDGKFVKYLKSKPNKHFIDPIKLLAHNKFVAKQKRLLASERA